MRPVPAIVLAMLTAATLLPFGQEGAAASCAGPHLIDADHLVVRRGSTVEVDGAGFADGCQDTGSCSSTLGCSHCDDGPEPRPLEDVSLVLRQRGRTWPLGTADAATSGGSAEVTWTVDIPTRAQVGWATLVPEHGEPVRIRIR